jgi:steroid 5-alpha reductase family enzyme
MFRFHHYATAGKRSTQDQQLHQDRITAIIVIAVILVLMGALMWLASFGGGATTPIDTYWPMLP